MTKQTPLSGAALLAWAMERKCRNPHSKLLLIALADWVGQDTFKEVSYAKLHDYSGLDLQQIMDALFDLTADRHAYCHQNNFETVGFSWPWHMPDPPPPERPRSLLRVKLWNRQNGECWYCGCAVGSDEHYVQNEALEWVLPSDLAYAEIEHQHPRSKGGRSNRENLVLSCRPCNREKSARTVDEYRDHLKARDGRAVTFHGERA